MCVIDWGVVLENIISGVVVAAAVGAGGWLFTKKYVAGIKFSREMRSYGFEQVSLKKQSRREVEEMCRRAERIKMIYVSGPRYFAIHDKALREAMKNGVEIQVLCAGTSGPFLSDIERMEREMTADGAPLRGKDQFISDEIETLAREYRDTDMQLRFYSTEYRLPYVIAYYKDGSVRAWLTVTLPPYRSKDSFVLRGKREKGDGEEKKDLDFIKMMEENFDAIWRAASPSPGGALYDAWMEKYQAAGENMRRARDRRGVLIEVAAQHPLVDGLYPNEEFRRRLLAGAELYRTLTAEGEEAYIYVPGSLHMDGGKADRRSLSEAGKQFLLERGVPAERIYGEEANEQYKGEAGVYNSSDECYVASRLFQERSLGQLHCVCSSGQMMRKALSYIQFGCLPSFHTVTTEEMHHNYIDEVFRSIPVLLRDERGLQGDSAEAERLRRTRDPGKGNGACPPGPA